jgi:hypothetical protein
MSDPPKPRPATTRKGAAETARKEERLAASLRENLRRRKAQARARETAREKPGKG